MANPTWFPNMQVTPFMVIVDSNGNIQQASADGGIAGFSAPDWSDVNIGDKTQEKNGGTALWFLRVLLNPSIPSVTLLAALAAPDFIGDADGLDATLVLKDMITKFQNDTGRTLYPAQPERLLINDFAYRETLVRNAIQYAGKQALVAFARAPMLDYLAQNVGVSRLQAQAAVVTIQLELSEALNVSYTKNAGFQVATDDGNFIFATDDDVIFPPGSTTATVSATATVAGSAANGYLPGSISSIISGDALIESASNLTTSSGGAEPEADDRLRTRIQLAPNSFTVAGPKNSYKFFALSADGAISDVQVTRPQPGTVNVYVLTGPITAQPQGAPNLFGIASSTLLQKISDALNDDDIRPLNDTVDVRAVTEIDYQITATVTLYADADPTTVQAAALADVTALALALAAKIKRDIVPSMFIAALSVAGVYQVALTSPVFRAANDGEWLNCTAINLTFNVSAESST